MAARPGSFDELGGEPLHPPDALHEQCRGAARPSSPPPSSCCHRLASVGGGYGIAGVTILLLGLSIGLATTPATDSIMGSLPAGEAGVSSAIIATTREVGGALGIAVPGSLTNADYQAAIGTSPFVKKMPATAWQRGPLLGTIEQRGQQLPKKA